MRPVKSLILILAAFFIIACGGNKNKKETLAKAWQVSDIQTESEIADSVKNAMLLSSTLKFTEEGHYTASGGIGADQGTYTLDEEGKILSTISSAGKNSNVYTIEDLEENKLVLKNNGTTIICSAITP